MNKKEAVESVLGYVSCWIDAKEVTVVTSCGHISRLAWDWNKKQYQKLRIIPLTGSMGMLISFTLGLSMADSTKQIIGIMGDGEFLMGFNALNNMRYERRMRHNLQDGHNTSSRLIHIVLNDNMYASTGGQKTAFCNENYLYYDDENYLYYDTIYNGINKFVVRQNDCQWDADEIYNLIIQDVAGEYEAPGRIPDDILSETVR